MRYNAQMRVVLAVVLIGTGCGKRRGGVLPPLHQAAKDGNVQQIQTLLSNHARINRRDQYDRTPLHWATLGGHTEVVKALIVAGADVNARTPDQGTPLHQAAQKGYQEVAKLLIDNGAKVNAEGKTGGTALHYAIPRGYTGWQDRRDCPALCDPSWVHGYRQASDSERSRC